MGLFKKNSKYGDVSIAVLVNKENITNLFKFLEKNFNEINFKGKTIDNTRITFRDINELLEIQNPTKRKLVELEISCSGENKSLNIEFLDDKLFYKPKSIKYHLEYDNNEWGYKFEDDLIEELKNFKPYYNYLTYLNLTFGFPFFIIGIGILYIFGDVILKSFDLQGYITYGNDKKFTAKDSIGFVWGFLLMIIGYIFEKIRNYLFPTIFIALGKQEKEFEKRKKISYFIFGIVLLGIIINIISTIIMK